MQSSTLKITKTSALYFENELFDQLSWKIININVIIHPPEYGAKLTAAAAHFGPECICVLALMTQYQLHLDIVKCHHRVELWMGTLPYN